MKGFVEEAERRGVEVTFDKNPVARSQKSILREESSRSTGRLRDHLFFLDVAKGEGLREARSSASEGFDQILCTRHGV